MRLMSMMKAQLPLMLSLWKERLRWILASFRSESPLQAFQDQDFKSCGVPEQWRLLSGENRTVFQNHCLFMSCEQ